jgi:hypothetical protein
MWQCWSQRKKEIEIPATEGSGHSEDLFGAAAVSIGCGVVSGP